MPSINSPVVSQTSRRVGNESDGSKYSIRQQGNKFMIVDTETDEIKGMVSTQQRAQRVIQSLMRTDQILKEEPQQFAGQVVFTG